MGCLLEDLIYALLIPDQLFCGSINITNCKKIIQCRHICPFLRTKICEI